VLNIILCYLYVVYDLACSPLLVAIFVGDIPDGYTSDVVLNQQARVAHQGGMADCLPGGLVAGEIMAVLDAGAHGGSEDGPMAGCLVVHA
jgi:hypothetical protein